MYFHTDNPDTIEVLAFALSVAHQQEKRVRLNVDAQGNLIYKIGEGIWSIPMESTEDPYRDVAMYDEMVVSAEMVKEEDLLTAFGNARVSDAVPYSDFYTQITFVTRDPKSGLEEVGFVKLSDCASVSIRRSI